MDQHAHTAFSDLSTYMVTVQGREMSTLFDPLLTYFWILRTNGITPFAAILRDLHSGVLGGIRGYTPCTNLRVFFDSVYSPQ